MLEDKVFQYKGPSAHGPAIDIEGRIVKAQFSTTKGGAMVALDYRDNQTAEGNVKHVTIPFKDWKKHAWVDGHWYTRG